MDSCSLDPGALRAATALVPRLRAAGTPFPPDVWRGNEWIHGAASPDSATTGFAALDQELPGQGWPRGQLVELLVAHAGVGELGLLLPALAGLARTGRSCVWVLPNPDNAAHESAPQTALPYAPALVEAGLDLAHHIFVKPLTARESGWALEQSLRSAHLGALIGWLPDTTGADADFRELRRLHLLAQRHSALVFVIRTARHARSPSPAALRLHLQLDGGLLQVQVLKRRGRPLLEPVALQIHPARWNRTPAPVSTETAAAPTAAATGAPAATRPGASRPGAVATLRTLVRAFAPQPTWTMPAALLPAATA